MIKIDSKVGKIAADYIDLGEKTPLIILTHGRGKGSRNGASKKIAEYLQNFGISSLRFDLYGYGDSDGKFEDISISNSKESWIGILEYVNDNLKKHNKVAGFGTSFGGSGLLAAAGEINPELIDALIFRSTIINYKKKTEKELGLEKIKQWKEDGFIIDSEGYLNYSYYADMEKYQKINYSRISKFKVLYFHGATDNKVNFSEVQEMKNNLKEKMDLIIYPNSGHAIDNPIDFEDLMIKTKNFVLSL